jgi:hypothetical protein
MKASRLPDAWTYQTYPREADSSTTPDMNTQRSAVHSLALRRRSQRAAGQRASHPNNHTNIAASAMCRSNVRV